MLAKNSLQIDLEKIISHFNNNGFYLLKNFFPREVAENAAEWLKKKNLKELAKTVGDQEPGVPLAVYQDIHKGESPIAQLASNKEMLSIASKLMGNQVYIWSSKVNLKAAWAGTAEYYHQDYVYWKDRGYKTMNMMTCIIFTEPHSIKNGGLHVFPGSHKKGFIEHELFININGLAKFMIPPKTLDRLYKDCGLKCIKGEPGDVLFFHTGLTHGSAHNISNQSRMIILSQLNTIGNKPKDVYKNTRNFNLERTQIELNTAHERYENLKEKYEKQLNTEDIVFNSPIPDDEK